jgi:hypothetical protein
MPVWVVRGGREVRFEIPALAMTLLCFPSWAVAADGGSEGATRFDGAWTATVTCPNHADALGYSFAVPSQVTAGVLHGERMRPGEPGWLVLDGHIEADGQAMLYAKGLVGAAPAAVGHAPRGTDYGYHVQARFSDGHGAGARVEGRPCTLDFERR